MENTCVNPFHHRFHFRTIDYIHFSLGAVLLFPIRALLFILLFILSSMMAKLFNFILDKSHMSKAQESKWRSYLKRPVAFVLRVAFFVAGFYRARVIDRGEPDADKKARILVLAPHTSPFDVLCGIALDCPSVVARHDVVDIPFFGNLIKITDPVFVERNSQSSRNNVVTDVLDKIKYLRMVFFPEGTCSNRRALCQFKVGAFKPGIPVQPVIVKYDQYGGPDTLSWTWDGPPALHSIILTFCRFQTGLQIIKLPVYYPSQEEQKDPELYAYNVSELMSKELQIPSLYYSFDDSRYISHSVYRSPVCLKFLKLCDKIANQSKTKNGMKVNNNYHSNGTANGVSDGHNVQKKDKKQMLLDAVIDTISDISEKIELHSPQDLKSLDDLISLTNLDKYPELCKSGTIKELHTCLKRCRPTPDTSHLLVVLQLCDIRVQSFWQRLENSFNTLAKNRLNGESNTITRDSLNSLLWLAFGMMSVNDDLLDGSHKITFENLEQIVRNQYRSCAEENARELFHCERTTRR